MYKNISTAPPHQGVYIKHTGRMYWFPKTHFHQVFSGVRYLQHNVLAPEFLNRADRPITNHTHLTNKYDLNTSCHLCRYASSIDRSDLAPLYIKFIHKEIGYGVFARRFIPKKTFIGMYTGTIKLNYQIKQAGYAFSYMPDSQCAQQSLVLDAASAGNETRFINDSPYPNIHQYACFYQNRWHLIFIAAQDIQTDKQLFFDYFEDYFRRMGIK